MALTMAQARTPYRNHVVYEGAGNADGDAIIVIKDADNFENYFLVSHVGVVVVEASLDNGTTWSSALALQDMFSTIIDQNIVSSTNGGFGLVIRAPKLRVLASGGAASARIACWITGAKS